MTTTIDGIPWTKKQDEAIDDAVFHAFQTGAGKELQKYLETLAWKKLVGPGSTGTEYAYQEGIRYVVRILEDRADRHVKRMRKDATAEPA